MSDYSRFENGAESIVKYAGKMPGPTLGALERYVTKGIPPGGFLKALLCNDLVGACCTADQDNIAAIKQIVLFVYNECPSECWGSKEKVTAWIESFKEIETNE